MRRSPALLAFLTVFCPVAQADLVVASFKPDSGSQADGISSTVQTAQTFTPTGSGLLSAVDLAVRAPGASGNLTLQLRLTDPVTGTPSLTTLASKTLTAAQVQASSFGPPLTYTTFDFSGSGVNLMEGVGYSLVVSSDSEFQFSVLGVGGNPYAGGEGFESNDGGVTFLPLGGTRPSALDFAFEVRVVPEPATLAALGLGTLALVRRRKRA